MLNIPITDQHGNRVKYLTQWDSNRKIVIDVSKYNLTSTPTVHFANAACEDALCVIPEMEENIITVDVPNILLQDPSRISVYIFSSEDSSSMTVDSFELTVISRKRPADYIFTENIEYVQLSQLIERVESLDEAEKLRAFAEQLRAKAELDRDSNERERIASDKEHENNEAKRIEAENDRAMSEQTRTESELERNSNETKRIENDKNRGNAEKLRDDAEAERKSSEQVREASENSRNDNEQLRVNAEKERASSESTRIEAERLRVSAEEERKSSESIRATSESSRAKAEEGRKSSEALRVESEEGRRTSEELRTSNENTRVEAEKKRNSSETLRADNESARVKAESERNSSESARTDSENARVEAENARANAESSRANAEEQRVTEHTTMKETVNRLEERAVYSEGSTEDIAADLPKELTEEDIANVPGESPELVASQKLVHDEMGKIKPDWNENDPESPNYIKNRIGYLKGQEKVLLLDKVEVKTPVTDGIYGSPMFKVPSVKESLLINQMYEIIFDNETFTLKTKQSSGSIGGIFNIYVGNASLFDSSLEDTKEPFAINLWDDFLGSSYLNIKASDDGKHTVVINKIADIYEPIPECYLPNSIRSKAGLKVEGTEFTYNLDGQSITAVANEGAEIFNRYDQNIAVGSFSHAEGKDTKAIGMYSHAEGYGTKAIGFSSYAGGNSTEAIGTGSHAEGRETKTTGRDSHAEGWFTTASSDYQHVQGRYNIDDPNGKYADIVGNGKFDDASKKEVRSNAYTLDWDGNGWYQGSVESSSVALRSTTPDSIKKFNISVDDTGMLKLIDNNGVASQYGIADIVNKINLLQNELSTLHPDSWAVIQANIKMGKAPELYPVGKQFKVNHTEYGDILFDVVKSTPESITLLTHDIIINTQFDAPESYYYAEEGLAPGTYYFDKSISDDGSVSPVQFTLSKNVPAGGVISDLVANNSISTYAKAEDTIAIETVQVVEGTSGTYLGRCDGKSLNMNHIHRCEYGSSNWKESAIRQFLNSSKDKGTYWKPQTKFDRPPSWEKTLDGWLKGMSKDFVNICSKTKHRTITNNIYEVNDPVNSSYETEDIFYIPSTMEMTGRLEGDVKDEQQYPFYKNANQEDFVKKTLGQKECQYYLRSPEPSVSPSIRCFLPNGYFHFTFPKYDVADMAGCPIACEIR